MGQPSFDPSSLSAGHNVWRGDALDDADAPVLGTGHGVLDAQLPGGGWPLGAMTEVLQSSPEAHVWELLLPALAQAVNTRGGPVVLIGAPYEPFGPALAAGGVPAEALMWVHCEASAAPVPRRAEPPQANGPRSAQHEGSESSHAVLPQAGGRSFGGPRANAAPRRAAPSVGAQHLWACEQALRCSEVAAVLAWLPHARVGELRRLQLAAAQHVALLFVFRPAALAQSASPARLRLQVLPAEAGQMDVHLLKRRGPPLIAPLTLPASNPHLTALLAASQQRRQARVPPQGMPMALAEPVGMGATVVRLDTRRREVLHALDRTALV